MSRVEENAMKKKKKPPESNKCYNFNVIQSPSIKDLFIFSIQTAWVNLAKYVTYRKALINNCCKQLKIYDENFIIMYMILKTVKFVMKLNVWGLQ